MEIIYISLVPIFGASLLARLFKNKDEKPNLLLTIMIALVLVIISGLRSNIGDTGAYIHLYKLIGEGVSIPKESYEYGFTEFLKVLNTISKDPQFMILTTAAITNIAIIFTLRKYPSLFELQTYLYIMGGQFIVSMNGIRQYLVAAILFASTKFIIERKFLPYLTIIIIMSTVHESAIIMIPIYFIANMDAWSKNTIKMILVAAIGFIFFYQLVPILFNILGNSGYSGYEEAIINKGNGANIIRVAVLSVPVILSYLGRNRLKELWPESRFFINISLVNLIFMCFALYNWIFARFTIYFELYNLVLLPYCIKVLFSKKEKDLIYYSCIVLYFTYFYYENSILLNIIYRSNILNVNI